ncbi:Uncharacterised protein [Mycobacteroides abscessus subsp. abscessus]|uniref:hypothetical protein n=1 Tax=Mycobacteroides abscessus TaxID=36809 RepID=UPI000928AB2A|nr:hypothetical protein [Mycobacteroides abscessus]SIM03259.1 Uncharacterised protein [Mycobacteroides abscessus subsp. abscessus]SLC78330.1 Uncharacterised protein [Mycobacteroides abscessus subsp. abscessus]
MGDTQTVYASYISRGDRFEHHAALRGRKPRTFVCEVISEPALYIDYRQEHRVQMLCRTTDPSDGRVHVGNVSLPESDLLTLVAESGTPMVAKVSGVSE